MPSTEEDIPETQLPKLLTAAQVAAWLGVSRKALYTMVERHEVPPEAVVRIGTRLRFDAEALNTWITRSRASGRTAR